jgi:hypothetical protein
VELVRDWRRQALRAAGATALVPALLLTAAVLLATGTGFGGIGSLGQVTGGPSLPAADAPAPREQARASRASEVALAPATAPAARTTAASTGGGARSTTRGAAGTAPSGTGNRVGVPRSPVTGNPVGRRTPTVTPTTPATTPPAGTPTSPTQNEGATLPSAPQVQVPTTPANPIQQVIDGTKGLTQALPAPLGQTVDRIVDTLDAGAPG